MSVVAWEKQQCSRTFWFIFRRLAKIACGTRTLAAIPIEAEERIGALARLYDLTIVLQPESSHSSHDDVISQAVLFGAGGPMLMVPYTHKGPLDARHVGIAWDGSRLAARALRDALPFLTAAETITAIAVNEDQENAGEASSDRLVSHLARRGINARVERLPAEPGNVHGAILSFAADDDIGLLVMGGYGRWRLQERILGGVTRGVFESDDGPGADVTLNERWEN